MSTVLTRSKNAQIPAIPIRNALMATSATSATVSAKTFPWIAVSKTPAKEPRNALNTALINASKHHGEQKKHAPKAARPKQTALTTLSVSADTAYAVNRLPPYAITAAATQMKTARVYTDQEHIAL